MKSHFRKSKMSRSTLRLIERLARGARPRRVRRVEMPEDRQDGGR